jgi:transcriptional regulator with XRE-family HTH domain
MEKQEAGFGQAIRERRRRLGLTQQEVAGKVATSVIYIGLLETGKRRPSAAVVGRLAEALGLERGELFFLANPEARTLVNGDSKPAVGSAWEEFRNNEYLQKAHKVTPAEMELLSRVALMGELRSSRDLMFVLNTVRQALTR